MIAIAKLKRMLRSGISTRMAALEAIRRLRVAGAHRRERVRLAEFESQPARLRDEFVRMSPSELLAHFQSRLTPEFFPGFTSIAATAALQQTHFPSQTEHLLAEANRIVNQHCWPLLGFGERCFGGEIDWHLDPLSGKDWPLSYHADINLMRNDGSDVRVLWELNRLAHFITLGRAYAITNNDRFSAEFFRQVASWRSQNPVARGVNWSCAMEVALRAMNLLATFVLFLRSPQMDELALKELLKLFDQHGAHTRRNLEFSHIATSNHYLCDVTGLLWLGTMLPELEAAREWREFGLRELLREMDEQILADGADYESSTGYHRLKLELFLYSFVLCHLNGIDIGERYWSKLHAMVDYVRAYLRPDGRAPLIGDSDSGQVMPVVRRAGDDHAPVLALGAAVFQELRFKLASTAAPEELLWILGERGLRDYQSLRHGEPAQSQAFPEAGTFVLRADDLYLLFNASGSGINSRGSHGHNDALSIEVSACGTAFIVDPGSYVYTANLHERHLFRSTAYHSTVEVDGVEQNSIDESIPFVIGNEAQPKLISWESGAELDLVVAEHYGYRRLPQPVTHRRSARFDKAKRYWLVEDEVTGPGTHELSFRFNLAPGLETKIRPDGIVEVCDKINGTRLLIRPSGPQVKAELEARFFSHDYGQKESSDSVCWTVPGSTPLKTSFALIPIRADEDERERVAMVLEACAEAPER